MPKFYCSCRQSIKADKSQVGKTVACPACGQRLQVPAVGGTLAEPAPPIRFLVPVCVGVIGSVLSLAVCYIDFSMLPAAYAFEKFQKWPWLLVSIGLTASSCIVPFFFHYMYGERRMLDALPVYAFGLLGILLYFFFYPGWEGLGLTSDKVAGWAIGGVCISQYSVAKLIAKQIMNR